MVVLIFMQIFALMSWYALYYALLAAKSEKNIVMHQQLFHASFHLLDELESELQHQLPICTIAPMDTNTLIAQTLDWWKLNACAGIFPKFQYYYVVEKLVDDPCATIKQTNMTAVYFRLTLLSTNPERAKLFLQSTVVRPNDLQKPCQGLRHIVQAGRQTWYELE